MSNTETKSIEEQAALMKLNEEHQEEKESKLTAAAALAGLVDSPAPKDEPTQVESNQEFHIPQRYTRSGRKRAVSFPLKVSKQASRS